MVDFTSLQSFPVPEKITELSAKNSGLVSKNKNLITGIVIVGILAAAIIIKQASSPDTSETKN